LKPLHVLLTLLVSSALLSCAPAAEEEVEDPSTGGGGGGSTVSAPSSLSAEFAVDFTTTPTVTVSGVTSGDTVTLYSDSACSTQVASGTASATTIALTTSTLTGSSFTFYAKTTSGGTASSCSTASAAYSIATCPTNYVKAPGNSSRSVQPFCVMKFEAKNVSNVATSNAATAPWHTMSPDDAKAHCVALNTSGNKYNLISNQEWLTLADDIASGVTNYSSSGTVGGFHFFPRGYSGNVTTVPVNVSDDTDYWSQTGSSTWEYRRVYFLSNGEVIWDLAGNANEIVDWGTNNTTYTESPGCGSIGTINFGSAPTSCSSLAQINYMPLVSTWTYVDNNVGSFQKAVYAGAITRGGGSTHTNLAGLYTLWMGDVSSVVVDKAGFRCVYRPSVN
jgi:hypothetical protein